ncbi:B12-binding domain-containing radical SAM protein [Opitutus sp. ER46]|uniref:B12-binding domain-containing radical SAM protein n=1 Tax=Opitutus sp. ER46 TaxID=2161864 RepID=UPI000D320524|nr:B12-binding domain-containing radical SAM protein [Opitutus sp. ER46]PTX92339.1 B12-binding domain-containing radical SAM protein [Opitutus sp. ER46]
MSPIVLATLNAKYIHASFGLRYLLANLGELRPQARLEEFTISQRPLEIAERILAHEPRIVGLGVYIWNVGPTTEVVALLKRIRPDLIVVLGGPEVSHETGVQDIVRFADYTITGEGDLAFAALCRELLAGRRPETRVIAALLPDFSQLTLPYDEYTDEDIAHRLIYVEASRGCPFSCEFCLSSLDVPVRQAPLEPFLAALDRLLARGVLHFKFVDRTFNLNLAVSRQILEFFLARLRPGLFLHFEMVPDRVPPELRELLARFPAGHLQLEIGIQTFNPEVATLISRRQNYAKLEENLRYLRRESGAHLHADLIAGLPGESLESFAAGFDRLVALGPQEIQLGILKRLRGTPIARHDSTWDMAYSPLAPYEILRNRLIDFPTMQRLRRFARYWDLVGNSGNFVTTTPLLWNDGASPFQAFLGLSDWLFAREGRHHAIALVTLMQDVFAYLTEVRGLAPTLVADALWRDFQRANRGEMPPFLRPHLPGEHPVPAHLRRAGGHLPARQQRHAGPDAQ